MNNVVLNSVMTAVVSRGAKSSSRIAAKVGRALQWEQWAVVRLMWKELLSARDVSGRNYSVLSTVCGSSQVAPSDPRRAFRSFAKDAHVVRCSVVRSRRSDGALRQLVCCSSEMRGNPAISPGAVQRFERKAWNRLIDCLIDLPPLAGDDWIGTRDHRALWRGPRARMKATIILPVVRAVPWQVF